MGSQQSSPQQELAKARLRAGSRLPAVQVSGRYHLPPRRLEDDYIRQTKQLGQGFSGAVFLVLSASTGDRFAVKPFRLYRITEEEKRELRNEVEVFLAMDHPHVARLRDVYESKEHLELVAEALEGGELFAQIQKRTKFCEQDASKTARQMLLAINYLHSSDIVHRDIKLENFMYDTKERDHLKLIDFGFSRYTSNAKMKLGCGTLPYMAPEVFGKTYTNKVDIWSMGVVVFILLLGYMPFAGSEAEIINRIKLGSYTMQAGPWARLSSIGKNFLEQLLEVDPERRLSAELALQHPFIVDQVASDTPVEALDDSLSTSLQSFAQASEFRRACMSMMAWSLTNEERSKVRAAFIEMDKDNTGTIRLPEMKKILEDKVDISDQEVRRIFDALDSNNDEVVNYSEFLASMLSSRICLHDDLVLSTFKRFDVDGNGLITAANLREVLGSCCKKGEAEQLIKEADCEGDGQISLREFVQYMQSGPPDGHQEALEKVIEAELGRRSERGAEEPHKPQEAWAGGGAAPAPAAKGSRTCALL